MRQQALTVNELLRHFWAAMPMELPGRQPKAQRMAEELQVLALDSGSGGVVDVHGASNTLLLAWRQGVLS